MQANPRRPRKLRIRKDVVRRLALERLGVNSDTALAHALGINSVNLSKLLNGHQQPSGITIATVLDAFDTPFETVFAIEPLDP